MVYRNGIKSTRMIIGEARSKKTNRLPLRLVVGVYCFVHLRDVVCAPILKCGHIDIENASDVGSAKFWRDGWKQKKFRCRPCGGDIPERDTGYEKCDCDYRDVLIQSNPEDYYLQRDESISFMKELEFELGYNLF